MTSVSKSGLNTDHKSRPFSPNHGEVSVVPFFLLGVIMPINVIQGIPPIALDIIRYGLALLILYSLRSHRKPSKSVNLLELVAVLLILSGGLSVLKYVLYGGGLIAPLVSIISPIVGYLLARKRIHHRFFLIGFTFGSA